MKLAILSDVHANFTALEAVVDDIDRWRPDLVIVGGDVINRGPRPRECLDLVLDRVRTQGWQCVLGNHEEYVLTHAAPGAPRSGLQFELHRNSFWTYQRVQSDLATLAAWPFQHNLLYANSAVRVVHASMLGTRAGIYRETTDDELRQKIAPPPDVLIVGHTHKPLIRTHRSDPGRQRRRGRLALRRQCARGVWSTDVAGRSLARRGKTRGV